MTSRRPVLLSAAGAMARDLHPEYFAMVMATGMLSLACRDLRPGFLTWPLFFLNWAFYICLWVVTIFRLAKYSQPFFSDLKQDKRAVGFFTIPAATCILASQVHVLIQAADVTMALLCFGMFSWFVLLYVIFFMLAVRPEKPSLEGGITPAWLLSTVATQTLSIVMVLVSSAYPGFRQILLLSSLCMFFLGATLYSIIITLIFLRLMFRELKPRELSSSYWINMGAEATTVLAGVTLVIHGSASQAVASLQVVITGLSVLFWATATWWIPLLLLLGAWRFLVHRSGTFYSPLHWGMVYPLGTYTYCTYRLAEVAGFHLLSAIPSIFVYFALTAWIWTIIGYLWSMYQVFSKDSDGEHREDIR